MYKHHEDTNFLDTEVVFAKRPTLNYAISTAAWSYFKCFVCGVIEKVT